MLLARTSPSSLVPVFKVCYMILFNQIVIFWVTKWLVCLVPEHWANVVWWQSLLTRRHGPWHFTFTIGDFTTATSHMRSSHYKSGLTLPWMSHKHSAWIARDMWFYLARQPFVINRMHLLWLHVESCVPKGWLSLIQCKLSSNYGFIFTMRSCNFHLKSRLLTNAPSWTPPAVFCALQQSLASCSHGVEKAQHAPTAQRHERKPD